MSIFEECLLQCSRRWVRWLTKGWELSPSTNLALAGFRTWLSLLVLYSLPAGFSMGTVVFPSHQNPNLLLDIYGPKPKRQGSVLIPENAIRTINPAEMWGPYPFLNDPYPIFLSGKWAFARHLLSRRFENLSFVGLKCTCRRSLVIPIHRTIHACCHIRYCKTTRGFR